MIFRVAGMAGLQRLTGNKGKALMVPLAANVLKRAGILGERLGKERAPVDTGRMRASLTHRLDARPAPQFVKVGSNVPYARYLDQPKSRSPRYRRGSLAGQSTRDWLTGVLPLIQKRLPEILDAGFKGMQAVWRR